MNNFHQHATYLWRWLEFVFLMTSWIQQPIVFALFCGVLYTHLVWSRYRLLYPAYNLLTTTVLRTDNWLCDSLVASVSYAGLIYHMLATHCVIYLPLICHAMTNHFGISWPLVYYALSIRCAIYWPLVCHVLIIHCVIYRPLVRHALTTHCGIYWPLVCHVLTIQCVIYWH